MNKNEGKKEKNHLNNDNMHHTKIQLTRKSKKKNVYRLTCSGSFCSFYKYNTQKE